MTKVLVTRGSLEDTAGAIRTKLGVQTTYKPSQFAAAIGSIPTQASLGTKTITQNGTYSATDDSLDGYSSVVVNVSGGGGSGTTKGFEVYRADGNGGTKECSGILGNNYVVLYHVDNMQPYFDLNGTRTNFSVTESTNYHGRAHYIRGYTNSVSNQNRGTNAVLKAGSVVKTYHNDSGSYISVVGGWAGYPSGGTIYENAEGYTTTNTIVMNSAHGTLLVFVGACSDDLSNSDTIDINGATYTVTKNGTFFDSQAGIYGAIVLENNSSSTIVVTFPASCSNYVSIIGI